MYDVEIDLSPEPAYNLVSPYYDDRHWASFWFENEMPLLANWLGSGDRFLDAGCGTCPYFSQVEGYFHEYYGLDLSRGMLEIAQMKYQSHPHYAKMELTVADLDCIPYPDNYFDVVLCTRVLSHMDDPERAFAEFYRVLKPGGRCFITDIHPHHDYEKTGFRIPDLKVYVDTVKHPISKLVHNLEHKHFQMDHVTEARLEDLHNSTEHPLYQEFAEHPDQEIFYCITAQKA